MWKLRTPAELSHFVPEPIIVCLAAGLLCPSTPGGMTEQRSSSPRPTVRWRPGCWPWPARHCPACKGQIGRRLADRGNPAFLMDIDHRTYCELCGSMDPRNEANVVAQRIEERAVARHRDVSRQVENQLDKSAEKVGKRPRLTEVERRRIWNGYKGGILAPNLEVTNRSKIGRQFLLRIKQEPNWNLILDSSGKVVGRHLE